VVVILATVPATVFAQGGRQSPDEFRRMLDMGLKHRTLNCTKH
jgi:hypothetical protein